MTAVSPFSERAEGNRSNQSNPLIRNSIFEGKFLYEQYRKELENLAGSKWLKEDTFNAYYETAKANYEGVCRPDYDFANADEDRFYFSLEGRFTSGDDDNMSAAEYFERILETYNKATGS